MFIIRSDRDDLLTRSFVIRSHCCERMSSTLQIFVPLWGSKWNGMGSDMAEITVNQAVGDERPIQPAGRPNLDKGFNPLTMILFFGVLAAGLLFVAYSIYADVDATGVKVTTYLPYL